MLQFASDTVDIASKPERYRELGLQLRGLFEGEHDRIANAANMSALLFMTLPELNWAGFYFLDTPGRELVVGPFQGKPACVRIAVGRGVCGTAVAEERSILVRDVHAFPGHIACDAASNSELVIPLMVAGKVIGVLDLDSPAIGRFDEEDQTGLERLCSIFVDSLVA